MIESRVLTDIDELARHAPAWRKLLERAAGAEPVLTPTWTLAWWRRFGEHRRLRALTLWDGSELVALAPLSLRTVLTHRAVPTRKVELLMTGEPHESEICSDYVGLLAAPGFEATLAHRVARALKTGELGGWDRLELAAMNGELPLVARLAEALLGVGIRAELEPDGACPYIPLPATWDAYVQSLEGPKRYVVTRALRELESYAGKDGWRFRRATDATTLAEGRAVLLALHGERWGGRGSAGVFADPTFRAFHDEVMPKLLAQEDGALQLSWLEARGEPIAAAYSIEYKGKIYFYQSGRKLELPKGLKAGIAIHALAIRQAIEEHRTEYDFLSGEAQYKRQLALAERPLTKLTATAPTLRATAVRLADGWAARAATRFRAGGSSSPGRPSRPARSSGT